jgi:Spy/CpxP family protein refolding chaperone
MLRKWAAVIVSTLALSAGMMATLSAAPQGRGHGSGPLGRIASRRLGLTDAQKQQLKGVADAHRDETTALRQRLLAARTGLREATAATPLDEALVKQRRADLSAVRADRTALRARIRAEMLQGLTPDQQAQLNAFQDRAHNRKRRRP